jgi:hypothetical protein
MSARMRWVTLGFALCAAAGIARAQSPAAEPTPEPAAPALPPVSAPPADATATDAALEARYHGAFEALARGERDVAVRLLESIVADAPQHSLADRARTLLSDLAATKPPPSRPSSWISDEHANVEAPSRAPPRAMVREQHPTSAARAELVFFQTVHGIALGAEVCAMASCDSSQPWVLSMMLGGGAGFGLSWHFSSHGITPGLSRALTDGVLWGAANGIGLAVATDASEHSTATGAFLAGGQLAGLGLAGLAYAELEPTAGQVSLAASGGLWSLVAFSELIGATEPHYASNTWAWILIGTGNAGVLAGALLAHSEPMTTSRVLLIDAGGLLGTLTGLGVAVLAQGDDLHAAATLIPGLVGTVSGLGVAYYLTRDWDSDELAGTQLHLGLSPIRGGGVASLSGYW